VWSKDKNRLWQIFVYYNQCNHFSMFKPTWATNVVRARFIWTKLSRPILPKSVTEVGRVARRTKKNVENEVKCKNEHLSAQVYNF
jgi:hypothetical protein